MGLKDRKKIKFKQKLKRRKKRLKLSQQGLDPDEYYFGKYYVGHGKSANE